MSALSSISSHEEDFDSGQSDHAPSSSQSQCNSSTSILTVAAAGPAQVSESFSSASTGNLFLQSKQVDSCLKDYRSSLLQNRESSATSTFRTAWTDSKHSSYLDYMEANFVQSMFGCNQLSEDMGGMMTSEYQQYGSTEESEEDSSAQSRLCIPYETMEFKMFDHRDRTWKACTRPTFPPHTPLILLASNPWVKRFRPKKPSATVPAVQLSSEKDMVVLPMTKEIESAEHVPGKEGRDSRAGQRKRCIHNQTLLDQGVDERDSSRERRALWSPYNQVLATSRRKVGASSPGLIESVADL